MKLTGKFKTHELLSSVNIAELFSNDERNKLGNRIVEDYKSDKRSREDWEKRMEESMKLALQVVETKSFPWPNASNVKFPLITIAALQYHARSYPVLIPSSEVVKCKFVGEDRTGELSSRASRVSKHMSWQVLEEDECWEDQTDKVLITQPIIGCAFKKTYFDPIKNHNVSENVFAKDLVVPYFTKSLETAARITHVLELSRNDVYERVAQGLYLDVELSENVVPQIDRLKSAQDKAQGVYPPYAQDSSRPYIILEQHLLLDLDGDGYEEPYIAVAEEHTGKLLRLVARYFPDSIQKDKQGNILSIKGENYFTKYPFIPSPDGGFYDIGFGVLLGPLNESINTLINQLIDAGTMANTAGGFLSRGIKIRGGTTAFAPNEWKPVESTGDDLRKGIMPLPVREPSQVLFTLLSLLINYGERIGGAVDILVGQNPGQNTPAETSRTMAEQGMKIFTGIFKRTYRSMKEEFRKMYRLNQLYMIEPVKLGSLTITEKDYYGPATDIVPAADPNMVSDSQRVMQAQALLSLAQATPGFNVYEIQKRLLSAWKIDDIETLLPDPKGPNAIAPPKNPKVQEAEVKAQVKLKDIEAKTQVAMAKLQEEAKMNQAKIVELEAKAMLALEQADGVQAGHQIAMFEAEIGMRKLQQDRLQHHIDTLKELHLKSEESKGGD